MTKRDSVRVLLVDDREEDFVLTRELLGEMLEPRVSLDWAATYGEGKKAIEQCSHDVYLVDYRLGPDDGLELLKEGRRICPNAAFVLLTAFGDPDLDERALALGAQDYLDKGTASGEVLGRVVRQALARREAEKQLHRQLQLAELVRNVCALANGATTLAEALEPCLEAVCAATGWQVGHAYIRPEGTKDLVSARCWSLSDESFYRSLVEISEGFRFVDGAGLPGRALTSGRVEWIADVRLDPSFLRGRLGVALPVVGALTVPVVVQDVVEAVIEFFSDAPMVPDSQLHGALEVVSSALGRVVERELNQRGVARLLESQSELILEAQRSENRLRRILETMADGVVMTDAAGKVTYQNPAAERILSPERGTDAASRRVQDVVRSLTLDRVPRTGESIDQEEASVDIGGERRMLVFDGAPLYDGGTVAGAVLSVRDVTERHREMEKRRDLEAALRRADKLEAVGRLASGVAHDFNNTLTLVVGLARLVLDDAQLSDQSREDLSQMLTTANRASALTRRLLAFSKKQGVALEPVDLKELIGAMRHLAQRLIGEDIRLGFTASEVPLVEADPGQIEQVILNLLVNARDAMPQGGDLKIELSLVDASRSLLPAENGESEPQAAVRISVADTGSGMDEDVLERVFEPFFTTKEAAGTGLGLPMVYGIIHEHGGQIRVTSKPGEGTRFDIDLPVFSEPGSPAVERASPPRAKGRERILLVEDDPPVRRVIARVLRGSGYEVIETAHGGEALDVLEKGAEVDLVLSDVVMPTMPGPRLLARVLERLPGLPVLLMSGYPEEDVRRYGALPEWCDQLIPKPVDTDLLLRKIRTALDLARSSGRR